MRDFRPVRKLRWPVGNAKESMTFAALNEPFECRRVALTSNYPVASNAASSSPTWIPTADSDDGYVTCAGGLFFNRGFNVARDLVPPPGAGGCSFTEMTSFAFILFDDMSLPDLYGGLNQPSLKPYPHLDGINRVDMKVLVVVSLPNKYRAAHRMFFSPRPRASRSFWARAFAILMRVSRCSFRRSLTRLSWRSLRVT